MSDAYLQSTCYLLKRSADVVWPGRHGKMTGAQRDVLDSLARGMTGREIADARGVKLCTVNTQLRGMFQVFNVHSQVGLLVAAVKAGLVTIGGEA